MKIIVMEFTEIRKLYHIDMDIGYSQRAILKASDKFGRLPCVLVDYYQQLGKHPGFYAAGYNNIWQKNYDKAEVYLAKGISEAQCVIQKREEVNYPQNPDFNKDLYAAREIMLILQKKETGWENLLEEKLSFLERDALEKVWGITLISGDGL